MNMFSVIISGIVDGLRRSFDFAGKSSRPEFWWFVWFCVVIGIFAHHFGLIKYSLVVCAVPFAAVAIRRLRDAGVQPKLVLLALFCPPITFIVFSALELMIENSFALSVPYHFLSRLPTAGAVLFFWSFLLIMLTQKESLPAIKREAIVYPQFENPALRARREAQERVEAYSKAAMTAFGLASAEAEPKAAPPDENHEEEIAAVCGVILDNCVKYAHGMLAPNIEVLGMAARQYLQSVGWKPAPENAETMDLEYQAGAQCLRDNTKLMKSVKLEDAAEQVGSVLTKIKSHIQIFNQMAAERYYELTCFTIADGDTSLLLAIETSRPSPSRKVLKIRLAAKPQSFKVIVEILSMTTITHAFDRISFDKGLQMDRFGYWHLDAWTPVYARDGLETKLSVRYVSDNDLKYFEKLGLKHPPCYVEFEIVEISY